jgi:ADP-dependent NAD(P)H-hydrate dehydratase / NAD(P)H-hydrate epimerase
MRPSYWLSQEAGKPLFPELEWSRPENRQHAGKLLVAGGNAHSFAAPAEAYGIALDAGIGTVRALLPDATRKIVSAIMPEADFAPSTPSGSFSQKAVAEFLDAGAWADGVLIAGDLGRNSETAVLLETFLTKFRGQVTLTKDAADYIASTPQNTLGREDTLLVISMSQLQRLATAAKFPQALTFSMDLLHLVEWLHDFTKAYQPIIIVKHLDNIFVAANGRVSNTKLEKDQPIWRLKLAARASVWWLQHANKNFEALTTAVIDWQNLKI